jgi:hypothetical protein
MGRPPKDIDGEMVRKLAQIGSTPKDIAEFFDCSQSVISERFRSDFQLGSAESKISLRRMQWKAARAGSVPMLIHLGKVHLGQSDRLKVTTDGSPTVVYIDRANNPRDAELGDAELDGWAEFGLSRFSASRGLDTLERAGLVYSVQRPGLSPSVTMLEA